MKKIVLYADWTDIIGHLTSFYAVCENEEGKTAEQIEKEKQAYLEENLKSFFASVKEIRSQGYDVDCHVITGGTREYIMPMFMEVFAHAEKYGELDLFKSLTLEYGSENINLIEYRKEHGMEYKEGQELSSKVCQVVAKQDPKKAFPEEQTARIRAELESTGIATLNAEYPYNYMQNVVLNKEDVTEEEFKEFCRKVRSLYGEGYTFYEYFCPGYGVEIDIAAPRNTKANAVKSIKKRYYGRGKGAEVDLEVIVGDYKEVELPMINETINQNVLVIATEESENLGMTIESLTLDIPPHLLQSKQKLGALSNALHLIADDIKNYDGYGINPFSKYDKEDYVY